MSAIDRDETVFFNAEFVMDSLDAMAQEVYEESSEDDDERLYLECSRNELRRLLFELLDKKINEDMEYWVIKLLKEQGE